MHLPLPRRPSLHHEPGPARSTEYDTLHSTSWSRVCRSTRLISPSRYQQYMYVVRDATREAGTV